MPAVNQKCIIKSLFIINSLFFYTAEIFMSWMCSPGIQRTAIWEICNNFKNYLSSTKSCRNHTSTFFMLRISIMNELFRLEKRRNLKATNIIMVWQAKNTELEKNLSAVWCADFWLVHFCSSVIPNPICVLIVYSRQT